MAGYVEVIAPVKGKGNFPAVEARHVGVGEKRLDAVLEDKANADSVYSKAEVDSELAKKVDAQSGYSMISDAEKTQIQTNKNNIDSMYSNSEIDTKIDKVVVTKESEVADTTKIIFKESEQEIEVPTMEDLKGYQKIISGDTSERPNGAQVGFCYFDITLNKPVWKSTSGWVDASGAEA